MQYIYQLSLLPLLSIYSSKLMCPVGCRFLKLIVPSSKMPHQRRVVNNPVWIILFKATPQSTTSQLVLTYILPNPNPIYIAKSILLSWFHFGHHRTDSCWIFMLLIIIIHNLQSSANTRPLQKLSYCIFCGWCWKLKLKPRNPCSGQIPPTFARLFTFKKSKSKSSWRTAAPIDHHTTPAL